MKVDNKSEEDEMMYFERAASAGRDEVHWYWETSRGNSNGEYDIALPANEWNHVPFHSIRGHGRFILTEPAWQMFRMSLRLRDGYCLS